MHLGALKSKIWFEDVPFYNILVANAYISPFNTQTMHIKTFYAQQHSYVFLKTLYPGGIRTRIFSRMWCPLCHAARADVPTYLYINQITIFWSRFFRRFFLQKDWVLFFSNGSCFQMSFLSPPFSQSYRFLNEHICLANAGHRNLKPRSLKLK
jgi:hypothetical protein